jgi:serine/threonine protein kinase
MLQLNILIDDSTKAVLCDFGLSRIKADATSRTVRTSGVTIVGSRYWMAPEQLLGGSPRKPCDIYAFGLTVYEVSLSLVSLENFSLKQAHGRFSQTKYPWATLTPPISSHL